MKRAMRVMQNLHREKKVFPKIEDWKIIRGDFVEVMSGDSKGTRGFVKQVMRSKNAVVVSGANLTKRHFKKTQYSEPSVKTIESPIHYSSVLLVDPKIHEPTRVKLKIIDGKQERVSMKTGEVIPRLAQSHRRKNRRHKVAGTLDTLAEEALKVSYTPKDDQFT